MEQTQQFIRTATPALRSTLGWVVRIGVVAMLFVIPFASYM
ncbi:MAG: hypothetical protein OEY97_13870 [Nitrospirota bacterium]|nr:hypothetical protein [Nitrospirota bacterium]